MILFFKGFGFGRRKEKKGFKERKERTVVARKLSLSEARLVYVVQNTIRITT